METQSQGSAEGGGEKGNAGAAATAQSASSADQAGSVGASSSSESANKPYDPAGVGKTKKKLRKRLKEELKIHGYVLRTCGSQTELRGFDEETGFWTSGLLSKPHRWLFNLSVEDGQVEAAPPEHERSDQLGYYNVKQDTVAGVTARAVPVIEEAAEETFSCYEDWEWIIFVFFESPLEGMGSSEMVSGFSPPNYDMEHNGKRVSPLGMHLYALCDPESRCEIDGVEVSYREATRALADLMGVADEPAEVSEPVQTEPDMENTSKDIGIVGTEEEVDE